MIIRDGSNAYGFIHNPRTSGSSITQYLLDSCGGRRLLNVPDHAMEHSIYAEEARYRNFENHYMFGFVRNPWSREWSLYKLYMHNSNRSSAIKPMDFKTWLMTPSEWYRNPQYGMFCDVDGKLKVNIFRFEERAAALREISEKINAKSEAFESHDAGNGTRGGMHYVKDYDQEMIDIIADRYKVDIDAFGYYFDGYENKIQEVDFKHTGDTLHYNVPPVRTTRYINV